MENLKLKNINLKGGYRIELSENQKGLPVAKVSRILSSGKNKGSLKQLENYYFNTEERRAEYIKSVVERVVSRENEKQAQKERL